MDSDIDFTAVTIPGNIAEIHVKETKTIRKLLNDLGLLRRHFVVLVDGKRATLDDEVEEGQRVLVLPIIAGG